MATGRDIAKFVTQITGKDYISLYDEAVRNDEIQTENIRKKFNNIFERMKKSDKNRFQDLID